MVGHHAHIETCFEVDPELIESTLEAPAATFAVSPRDRVLALLERMAVVARPRQGAARMLLVFARLAECEWLKGTLVVSLEPAGERTRIALAVDSTLGRRSMHAPFDVDAPLDEFVRALDRGTPELAALERVRSDPVTGAVELHARAGSDLHSRETVRVRAPVLPAGDPPSEAASTRRQPPPIPARAPRSPRSGYAGAPTMKIPVVRIPREAFRDDQDEPPQSRLFTVADAPEHRTLPAPEPHVTEPPATQRSPDSNMDDIDEGWD